MANSEASREQSRFDFDVVTTGVRSNEHLATRRRILEKPDPRMNRGTLLWVKAVVDEWSEELQLLRETLAARQDRISQLKRQLREERQLRNVRSADEELEKHGQDRQRADKSNRRSADEELGKLSNRSADDELGKQSQDRQRVDKINRRSAD
jgi:hypothetical protein